MRTFLMTCLPASALAVPVQLAHQGRLLDSDGTPIDGSVSLQFEVRDGAGGSASTVWQDTLAVDAADGYYSVVLDTNGSAQSLQASMLEGEPWLRITGPSGLLGEQRLYPAPQAALAHRVSGEVVLAQTTGTTCSEEGALVYDPTLHAVKVCVGTTWTAVASGGSSTLGDAGNPGETCADIKANRTGATDSAYWVQPPGAPSAFQVWCEMDLAQGGWTMVSGFNPYATGSWNTRDYLNSVATSAWPTTENPSNTFVNAATQGAYPHTEALIVGGNGTYIRIPKTAAVWTSSFLGTGGAYPSNEDFPVTEASWTTPGSVAHAWWCESTGCTENITTASAEGGGSGCAVQRIAIDSTCGGSSVTRLYIR